MHDILERDISKKQIPARTKEGGGAQLPSNVPPAGAIGGMNAAGEPGGVQVRGRYRMNCGQEKHPVAGGFFCFFYLSLPT